MNQDAKETADYGPLLDAWMKSLGDFWGAISKMSPAAPADTYGMPEEEHAKKEDVHQSSAAQTMRLWSTYLSLLKEPPVMQAMLQGSAVIPALMMRLAQSGWEGYFDMQRQWTQKMAQTGQRTEAYQFENLDENMFRTMREMYEKEVSPFLKVPQLGLTRFYQERANHAVDKFHKFQAAVAEFCRVLYLPMEKTAKVMQQNIEEMTKAGNLPENPQEYYRIWIKVLEGHYMTLFKSPEYAEALKTTLDKLEDFLIERQKVLEDMLQTLPVPTHREMDGLYREIHTLKKEVKGLKKKRT